MNLIQIGSQVAVVAFAVIVVGTLKFEKNWWQTYEGRIDRVLTRLRTIDARLPTAVVVAVIVLLYVFDGVWTTLLSFLLAGIVAIKVLRPFLMKLPFVSRLVGDSWETVVRTQWALPANVHDSNILSMGNRLLGIIPVPRRSMLVLGASGSGKTEVAKHIVYQTDFDDDVPIVCFDRKDDYKEMFNSLDIPYERITVDGSDVVWNCFEEFENERDIDEFARSLYPEGSDFFDKSAPMVFSATIKALVRQNDGYEGLTNQSLVNYFNKSSIDQIYDDISEYDDLTGAASAINAEKASKQAQGVYANLQQTINRVFVGDFEASPDDRDSISMREYIQNPDGKVVVLDFPNRNGETTKPIFRFLIDQAASFAMDQDGESYFILDEFAQIPHLKQVETLLNVGRGQGVHVLSTLQSISQMNDNYGEDEGESMLAGFDTQILLRGNDDTTVEHIQNAAGTEWHEGSSGPDWLGLFALPTSDRLQQFTNSAGDEEKRTEQHHFSAGEIRQWNPGEGVIVRNDGWIKAYIPMIETTRHRYDKVLDTDPEPAPDPALDSQDTQDKPKLAESVSTDD